MRDPQRVLASQLQETFCKAITDAVCTRPSQWRSGDELSRTLDLRFRREGSK